MGAKVEGTPVEFIEDGVTKIKFTIHYTENGQNVVDEVNGDVKELTFLKSEVDTVEKARIVLANFSQARLSDRSRAVNAANINFLANLKVNDNGDVE
jgi:hypothetical protein